MEVFKIENLTFCYPDEEKKAIDNVSLTINEGEFDVICGQTGCGKSTLFKLLKKEIEPYGRKEGSIFYLGKPWESIDNYISASEIGFVSQNPESQIVTDEVWHELAFGLENLGLDMRTIRMRVAEMANYFGIEEWFHKKTAKLSGGQKQMLNLASVMAMQPKVLLLDEPTAQLDPIAASNFIATLKKINHDMGITILLIEHRLEEVFSIADRIMMMEKGRLVYADSPRKINTCFRNNPGHPMTAGLPAAIKIFSALEGEGEAPLTVREGRRFVTDNYRNEIDALEEEAYYHNEEKAVELKDVWFRYERNLPDVMRGVSFEVYKGEHFCILGGNGTGKTTALGVIAGLLTPYRGKVLINGKKIKEYAGGSLYVKNVALLPQNPQTVFLEKTVGEDLYEACKTMKYESHEAEEKITHICDELEISGLMHMHPYDLSGGEQQKAALAKILLQEPEILLMDEPTKGMDAHAKLVLEEIIRRLKNRGITIITVTHDVEFAALNSDRCGMYFDGELTAINTPVKLFSGNSFYTTAAGRISAGYYKNAILCEQVTALCKMNTKKRNENVI